MEKAGKTDLLETIASIKNMANIVSIRQKQALGLGHAVYTGRPVIGDEPFAVLLGDELMIRKEGHPECTQQLTDVYEETQQSVVAVMEVAADQVHKYGIIECEQISDHRHKVLSVVEKPTVADAPSRLALPGRYVFTKEIFDYLKNTRPGKNGEIQLTDGMTELAKKQGLLATLFHAQRFDAGDKLGYLQANLELALTRDDLAEPVRNYLKSLCSQL